MAGRLHRGQLFEFFNGTTEETRTYELESFEDQAHIRGARARLRNLENDRYAEITVDARSMTLTARQRRVSRRSAVAERICTSYVVEKVDLLDPDSNLDPETWECATAFDVGIRLEDLLGLNPLEVASQVAREGSFQEADYERGVEVTVERTGR